MRKVLKIVGIIFIILIAIVGAASVVSSVVAGSRLSQTYEIPAAAITIPTDEVALARGEYLANTICTDCHGPDLAGEVMIDEAGMATISAPNITPSEAGVGHFTDADYVRAIRHAVDPEGKGYMIMPAEIFINWSEEDLGATIAYLQSLPPSDKTTPQRSLGALGNVLFTAGIFGDIVPAEYVDHEMPYPQMPQISQTAEYGEYMSRAFYCAMCHGEDLRGGPPPANFQEMGEVPSTLSAAGWTPEQFLTAVTTGVKPDGSTLNNEYMPWESIAKATDEDLLAIYLYLQELAGR
jgi:mono/diheme cytochrome c family protein